MTNFYFVILVKFGINTKKYISITKVSKATAVRDITGLLEFGCIQQVEGTQGRNVRYEVNVQKNKTSQIFRFFYTFFVINDKYIPWGKNMKFRKITSAVFAASILLAGISSTASAESMEEVNIHGGYVTGDMGGSSVDGYSAGLGFNHDFGSSKNWVAGFLVDFGSLSTDNGSSTTIVDVDFLLGYNVTHDFEAYAFVGISSADYGTGPAYGLGVKYQVIDYVAFDLRYKIASLSPESGFGPNLEMNTATAGVEFNFETSN